MRVVKSLAILLFAVGALCANEPQIDPKTKLKIAKGFETVSVTCTACHGASQIYNTGLTRDEWLEAIRWMQAEEGLWQFEPAVEKEILDYLETNYPPKN